MITLDLIAKEHFHTKKMFQPVSTKVMLKICTFFLFLQGDGTQGISCTLTMTATSRLLRSAPCEVQQVGSKLCQRRTIAGNLGESEEHKVTRP